MEEAVKPTGSNHRRIICFQDKLAVDKFDEAFVELLARRHHEAVTFLLPAENIFRYNHGSNWDRPAHANAPETKMKTLSTNWELPFQALVDNDLGVIDRSIGPITSSMERQFAEMMYGTVGEAAEQVGNVIDAKQMPSLAEAYLAMLEKIEMDVDRNGELNLPEMHAGPDIIAKMTAALEAQPPEFKEKVDRILAQKKAKAIEAEANRKSKFKKPPAN